MKHYDCYYQGDGELTYVYTTSRRSDAIAWRSKNPRNIIVESPNGLRPLAAKDASRLLVGGCQCSEDVSGRRDDGISGRSGPCEEADDDCES